MLIWLLLNGAILLLLNGMIAYKSFKWECDKVIIEWDDMIITEWDSL